MYEKSLKNQTKKSLYWNFLQQFAGTGIAFVIGIIMARLLTPEDYGITAIPAVFLAVSGIFIGGGFSAALIRKNDLNEADLSTAFLYSVVVGILFYIILFASAPFISNYYQVPVLTSLIRVSSLSFMWGPLGVVQTVILTRNLNFKTQTKINLFSQVSSGIIGIILAYSGYGLWALVLSSLIGNIINVIILWWFVRWFPKHSWSKSSFQYLWGFGNKMMASSLLDTIYNNITPLFIGKYYSPNDLGVYNRAYGYANLPSKTITTTLQSVTFPVLSKLQDDDVLLAKNYRKMLRVSCFIVFPLMTLLAALAHPLVIVMITSKWEACVPFLKVVCFSMMWYPIHAINLNLLQVKGRSDLFLRLEIIKKILGVLMLVITLPLGILIFCIGTVFTSIICLFINTYYTGKLIGVGFYMQMKDIAPSLILSIVIFLISSFVIGMIPDEFLQIIVGGCMGLIVYVCASVVLKVPEIKDIIYLLTRK